MAAKALTPSQCKERTYRKTVRAWCMYDWANSAFAVAMTSLIPAFYVTVACSNSPWADAYWGYANSLAMLLIALSAPILGALADHYGARKSFLGGFASAGILLTVMMIFVGTGDWLMASALFVLARVGFGGANIFYDSLLPHVARPGDLDRVSAWGYAYGYLGGGLLLALNVLMIHRLGETVGLRLSFATIALWWLAFSIPLFRGVGEPRIGATHDGTESPVRAGIRRLRKTFSEIRRYRELFKFLLAFWLYNDGINTIMVIALIFAKTEYQLSSGTLVAAILMVQFVGVPCAIAFGALAKRIGPKRGIYGGLAVYTLIAFGAFFMSTALHFWLLAFAVALVQGGTQALSRSLYGAMSPKTKAAEFFAFFSVSAKFAAILGPAMYGVIKQTTSSGRLATLSLAVFFIGGIWLLRRVNVEEGIRVAKEENNVLAAKAFPTI